MAKRKTLIMRTPFTSCLIYMYLGLCAFDLTTGDQHQSSQGAFETAKHWKLFSYNFLPNAPLNDPNFFNPMNVLATGIAIDRERIFIATPKLFSGVPSTVSYVFKNGYGDSPVLQAYPDWSFSTTARKDFNCSDLVLISVYRLRIDSCNRLWVLDAGISRSLEDYEITCPPKILIIDLYTNHVVRRVDFPKEILRGESLFTNLIVDETTSHSGSCDDVFAYITDTVEPGIIVYDSNKDVTWRLSHPAMFPDPDFAQSEILNDQFILMDGVVGLTFDTKAGIVYFQPLATDRVFSVSRDVLRAGPLGQNEILQVKLVGKKSSQGIGLAVSPIDGSLIFSPLSETAIASWNPTTNQQTILAYDQDRLQFVADITTSHHDDNYIYAVSSKFQRFFLKNLNTNEINNRILRIKLPNAFTGHKAIGPVPFNYASYGLKSLVNAVENYPNNYYQTNTLERSPVQSLPPRQTEANAFEYFKTPAQTRKHPYNFEPVGLINYSLRNPFTALNQGESFPPRKGQRSHQSYRPSFLDSLPSATSAATQHNGYHYGKGLYRT